MVRQDTIQHTQTDTTGLHTAPGYSTTHTARIANDSLARIDSLLKVDSLARVDSLHKADSLKAIVIPPRGRIGTSHPSFVWNEAWVFGCLLGLFFLLIFAVSRSGSLIQETIRNFFQTKARSSIFSKATVNDFKIKLFLILFSIGVLSMYAYSVLHQGGAGFSFVRYLLIFGVTLLFFGLKSLLFDLLGYVFVDQSRLSLAKDGYFNMLFLWGMIMFPLLILRIYSPIDSQNTVDIIALTISFLAALAIIFKLFQIFFSKILASFYLLLYLCTLEFLPLIALYQVYQLII